MSLVAVASAKGSPGATAVAVTLAALWPRDCVLADCDPAGGDVALRYGGEEGQPLDPDRGLLSLAAAARRGVDVDLDPHLQVVSGGLPVLAGVSNAEQVVGLGSAWPHVARSLANAIGRDVVADCGRVVPGATGQAVLEAAGAVLFVVRPTVEQLAHLRERLRSLTEPLGLARPDGVPTGVVVVASERERNVSADVERLLASSGLRVPVVGHVADDVKGVRAVELRRGYARRSAFVRSVRGLVPSIDRLVHERRLEHV